ncbi:uncharacterized protein LOC116667777 isoform X3 [Camelus ferus]|uniref:Uncharacterized protein LOC116667777 isoform X3 n=1 Tax=Camelus ferus TaxID=419612 RepID=A0A8B8U513_CAMFR|nr:uncharacterized protein LOC116667777 isoform X3 [Camelus ferus]
MATYPPRRLLGARPLPSDLRRDPRRSGFPQGGGGRWERRLPTGQSLGPGNLRYWCTHFQGPAARQHHLLRIAFKIFLSSLFCSFTLCVQPFPLRIYKEEIVKEIKEEEKLSQITRIQEVKPTCCGRNCYPFFLNKRTPEFGLITWLPNFISQHRLQQDAAYGRLSFAGVM